MEEKTNIWDPYYISNYLYSLALKDDDMRESISKVLYLTKICFNADNVILYKQNENGDYIHTYNSALMNQNSEIITSILNHAHDILKNNKKYELSPNFDYLRNVAYLKISEEYIVALTGNNNFTNLNDKFLDEYIKTMNKILSKLEQFELLMRTSEIDILTDLGNRNKYEKDISEKQVSDGMIYAIFDLFRLKSINDNYSHQKGDMYIKKTAEILKKHFPKYIFTIDSTGKKVRSETGTNLYRIGGDEFVLISNTESFESANIKMMIIQDEVKNMDLGVSELLGVNYGLIQAEATDTFRDLYLKSDMLLEENKKDFYQKTGYNRRK